MNTITELKKMINLCSRTTRDLRDGHYRNGTYSRSAGLSAELTCEILYNSLNDLLQNEYKRNAQTTTVVVVK